MKHKQPARPKSRSLKSVIRTYWIHLLFIFFLTNFAITKAVQLKFFAQSCLTKTMIESDQRCLYIYANNVYEKGSRNSPHHGNPCGSDVTSILPSSHLGAMARYLDPNIAGSYCGNIVPTNTPQPTAIPTTPPQPTNTPRPTDTPRPTSPPAATVTPAPTTASAPTATPRPSLTPNPAQPTNIPTQKPNPTSTTKPTITSASPHPTITPTPIPPSPTSMLIPITETSNGTGFGKFIANAPSSSTIDHSNPADTGVLSAPTRPTAQQFWSSVVFWSELFTVGSFILVIVSLIFTGVRHIVHRS